jgi:hypothetical protein
MCELSEAQKRLRSIVSVLAGYRYSFQDETELQNGVAAALATYPTLNFQREYRLSALSRPDFFSLTLGLAIEVKIKFRRTEVLRQLHRYAEYDVVRAILLVTTRSCHMIPEHLNSKPIFVLNVGRL